jgi:hypothetical protein
VPCKRVTRKRFYLSVYFLTAKGCPFEHNMQKIVFTFLQGCRERPLPLIARRKTSHRQVLLQSAVILLHLPDTP